MSIEQVIVALLGIANTMGAMLIRSWLKKLEDTEKRLADFQTEVPKIYVTKSELERDIDRILGRFDKLEAKLDAFIASRKE